MQSHLNLNTTWGAGFARIESDDVAGTVAVQRDGGGGAYVDALTIDQTSGDVACAEALTSGGAVTSGGAFIGAVSAAASAVATGGTIDTSGVSVARVAPAAAVTGVILQPGTADGQVVTVANESASADSVTFAASGTSNVADGVSDVVAGATAHRFVWDAAVSLWFHCV